MPGPAPQDTRCKNRPGKSGMQCWRESTGDDGLCNVCRAAKRNGERQSQRALEERQRQTDLQNELYRREQARIQRDRELAAVAPEMTKVAEGLLGLLDSQINYNRSELGPDIKKGIEDIREYLMKTRERIEELCSIK